MDKMDNYYMLLLEAELQLAQWNPLVEAEYQLEREKLNPLKLYDCYLPVFKNFRASKPEFLFKHQEEREIAKRKEDSYFMSSNQLLRS